MKYDNEVMEMKTSRIKSVRIHLSDKRAPLPIVEEINRLHVRWIEKELIHGEYDKETKFKIIDGIIKKLRAQEPTTA